MCTGVVTLARGREPTAMPGSSVGPLDAALSNRRSFTFHCTLSLKSAPSPRPDPDPALILFLTVTHTLSSTPPSLHVLSAVGVHEHAFPQQLPLARHQLRVVAHQRHPLAGLANMPLREDLDADTVEPHRYSPGDVVLVQCTAGCKIVDHASMRFAKAAGSSSMKVCKRVGSG